MVMGQTCIFGYKLTSCQTIPTKRPLLFVTFSFINGEFTYEMTLLSTIVHHVLLRVYWNSKIIIIYIGHPDATLMWPDGTQQNTYAGFDYFSSIAIYSHATQSAQNNITRAIMYVLRCFQGYVCTQFFLESCMNLVDRSFLTKLAIMLVNQLADAINHENFTMAHGKAHK